MSQHWINKYLTLKHEKGGRGPDKVDCWGLVFLFYKNEFGITLPEYPGIAQSSLQVICDTINENKNVDWVRTQVPLDGAAVGMGCGALLQHVGLWATADGGKIVHCSGEQCIVADTLRNIKVRGFRTIEFYHHRLWPSLLK